MDQFFSLPAALTATPSPLVALIGLDSNDRHSHLWRAFSAQSIVSHAQTASQTQPASSVDRVPLRWLLLTDVGSLPQPKPKRSSYEWFIPKGILKTNWLNKHLSVLPAVAVIFMELDWNDPNWSEKKSECASRVQSVRAVLQGRATKLAVVLIQHEPSPAEIASGSVGVSDGANATEKAAELCSACELSPRSLFVLPVIGRDGSPISDAGTLSGYVGKLEHAFYDLAQNYYHQEIRNVKSHRDFLNKTTHLYLFVRHQFKSGFLNELKKDPHSAFKHYQQAYNLLMEVRATDTNIMEVKTVAGFINYKICRLAFQLNLPRDAIAQFRRHMDIFKHKIGAEGLAFEHSGWQSEQSWTFAEIFSDAIRHGLPAIQTQHPGLYYQQAAQYAISRRKLAEELCSEVETYPDPDPLANEDKLDFYGQRPWRPGKVSIEPPDMELERTGIRALLFRERTLRPTHSDRIVELLSKAIEQFRAFRSPRAQSHLSVQMAEELMAAQKYRQALDLLKPIVEQYRRQGWKVLLNAALSLSMKCAFLTASLEDYVAFGLELAKKSDSKSSTKEEEDEKHRILLNISKIFSANGQIPSAEPGLTSKAERAAVGEAAKLWSQLVSTKPANPIKIHLDHEVAKNSALCVFPVFDMPKIKADQKTKLTCHLKYDSPGSDNSELAFPLRSVRVCITHTVDRKLGQPGPTKDVVYLKLIEEGLGDESETLLFPGKARSFDFELLPDIQDVGKRVVVKAFVVSIGHPDSNVELEMDMTVDDNEEEVNEMTSQFLSPKFFRDNLDVSVSNNPFSKIEIEPRSPNLKMKLRFKGPILVNEWFVMTAELTNDEIFSAHDVIVSASLTEASDPIISDTTRLVLDFKLPEPVTPMTPSDLSEKFSFASPPAVKKLSEICPNDKVSIRFFLKASTTAQRSVNFNVDYSVEQDGKPFRCFLSEVLHLETVEPFVVMSDILSVPRQLPLETAFTDEPFLILPELKSLSGHALKVVDSSLEVRFPVRKLFSVPSQLSGSCFERDSVGNECFTLVVHKKDLIKDQMAHALEEQDVTVGRYVIKWIREEFDGMPDYDDDDFVSVSTFELTSVRVRTSSIFASTVIAAPFAVVRTPLQVSYVFINRSERVQEFVLTMEPSEAFMLSGNKQLHFKLLPSGGKFELHYILYPLLAGESVPLPRPRLTSVRLTSHDDDVTQTLDRLLSTHITVLPRKREKDSTTDVVLPSKLISTQLKPEAFELQAPVLLPNLPFNQIKLKAAI